MFVMCVGQEVRLPARDATGGNAERGGPHQVSTDQGERVQEGIRSPSVISPRLAMCSNNQASEEKITAHLIELSFHATDKIRQDLELSCKTGHRQCIFHNGGDVHPGRISSQSFFRSGERDRGSIFQSTNNA